MDLITFRIVSSLHHHFSVRDLYDSEWAMPWMRKPVRTLIGSLLLPVLLIQIPYLCILHQSIITIQLV